MAKAQRRGTAPVSPGLALETAARAHMAVLCGSLCAASGPFFFFFLPTRVATGPSYFFFFSLSCARVEATERAARKREPAANRVPSETVRPPACLVRLALIGVVLAGRAALLAEVGQVLALYGGAHTGVAFERRLRRTSTCLGDRAPASVPWWRWSAAAARPCEAPPRSDQRRPFQRERRRRQRTQQRPATREAPTCPTASVAGRHWRWAARDRVLRLPGHRRQLGVRQQNVPGQASAVRRVFTFPPHACMCPCPLYHSLSPLLRFVLATLCALRLPVLPPRCVQPPRRRRRQQGTPSMTPGCTFAHASIARMFVHVLLPLLLQLLLFVVLRLGGAVLQAAAHQLLQAGGRSNGDGGGRSVL